MATMFFQNQESARRSSRLLIVLLILAVVTIVLAVSAVLVVVYFVAVAPSGTWARAGLAALPRHFFAASAGGVLALIGAGTTLQILQLRAGGEAVARMVGARAIEPGTQDSAERRLLNVIEEMALASGIPAPRAYVLDGERGINAFAAGRHPNDAIVAVTQGALLHLNRAELQGVVGHELSHILNGDMGLNLRLIVVLQGLLVLALFGRLINSWGGGRKPNLVIWVTGLAVLTIGYIGVFFARVIKASVSRQREFLADASSVQFTRNPDCIGGALRKIGGLGAEGGAVEHVHAETLSHMFLAPSSVGLADGLLASHPPLYERLRRIYGRPVQCWPADELPGERPAIGFGGAPNVASEPIPIIATLASAPMTLISPLAGVMTGATGPLPGAAAGDSLHASIGRTSDSTTLGSTFSTQIDALGLRPALSDTLQAQVLIVAMLLDTDTPVRARQVASAVERFGADVTASIERYSEILAGLPPGWRLPLIDLSMPALRLLTPQQRDALFKLAHTLIEMDGRITLPEFLLYSLLKRRLAPARAPNGPGLMRRLDDMMMEATQVMSLIACVRLPDEPQRAFDAGKSLLPAAGPLVPQKDLELSWVSTAFDRLANLAPLQKPQLIKTCIAIAFVDGSSEWRAVSCLRTLCAALDCPIPPQVEVQD
jgi:Zn-dependent protease with chaperone function